MHSKATNGGEEVIEDLTVLILIRCLERTDGQIALPGGPQPIQQQPQPQRPMAKVEKAE